MLAIARVVGETAPLLVTTGVITSANWNPFEGRMMNLSVFAYFQYKTPGVPGSEPYFARAWAAALTLIVIVLVALLRGACLVSLRWGRTEILK